MSIARKFNCIYIILIILFKIFVKEQLYIYILKVNKKVGELDRAERVKSESGARVMTYPCFSLYLKVLATKYVSKNSLVNISLN